MGNYTSCVMVGNNNETIQLVCSDGSIRILPKSVKTGQIMQEFPQHLVCYSDSLYIGQKTPSLSPNDRLKAGNNYFLLPDHFFQSPLSLVTLASLISPPPTKVALSPTARTSSALRSIGRASALCQPFDIQKSDVGGGLRIKVCSQFITKLMEDGRVHMDKRGVPVPRDSADDEPRLCNTPELQKAYKQLVKSRVHCWRPKLESIREKEEKVGHKISMKIKRSMLMNSS